MPHSVVTDFMWHSKKGIEVGKYLKLHFQRVKWTKWISKFKYLTHRIAGVLDFIHRPDFNSYKKKKNKHDVSETGSPQIELAVGSVYIAPPPLF
jgi:hypothetical protein